MIVKTSLLSCPPLVLNNTRGGHDSKTFSLSCPPLVLNNTRGGHDSKIFLLSCGQPSIQKYQWGRYYKAFDLIDSNAQYQHCLALVFLSITIALQSIAQQRIAQHHPIKVKAVCSYRIWPYIPIAQDYSLFSSSVCMCATVPLALLSCPLVYESSLASLSSQGSLGFLMVPLGSLGFLILKGCIFMKTLRKSQIYGTIMILLVAMPKQIVVEQEVFPFAGTFQLRHCANEASGALSLTKR